MPASRRALASGSGVPSRRPPGNTAARVQPGGRVADSGQDAGRLQRAGRPENVKRRALWSNPGSLYRTVGHILPPLLPEHGQACPHGGRIMRWSPPFHLPRRVRNKAGLRPRTPLRSVKETTADQSVLRRITSGSQVRELVNRHGQWPIRRSFYLAN